MRVRSGIVTLACLALNCPPLYADIHKCNQGGRLIYQAAPCPAGSRTLPPPELPPRPSAYAEEEARQRASRDIAAAEAIRQRERKEAGTKAREAIALARKQARACDRLRDRIDRAEADAKPGRRETATLRKDRRAYREACGEP